MIWESQKSSVRILGILGAVSDTLSLWEMSALGGDPYGVCQGFQSCRMGKSEDLRVPGMTPNILEVSWVSQGIRRDCLRLQVPQGDRLDLVTPGPDTRFQSPSELRVFSGYLGIFCVKYQWRGTSLVVQWLRLCAPNAGGTGSIPGQGTKIPHATRHSPKEKKKKSGRCL